VVDFEANDDLVEKVAKLGVPYCVVIGDSRKPRRIIDAVHEGYWAVTTGWIDCNFLPDRTRRS